MPRTPHRDTLNHHIDQLRKYLAQTERHPDITPQQLDLIYQRAINRITSLTIEIEHYNAAPNTHSWLVQPFTVQRASDLLDADGRLIVPTD